MGLFSRRSASAAGSAATPLEGVDTVLADLDDGRVSLSDLFLHIEGRAKSSAAYDDLQVLPQRRLQPLVRELQFAGRV